MQRIGVAYSAAMRCGAASRGARIAMHLAVLHDHDEAVGADQHRLVLERIAVDQQQVGERAFGDDAEFALVPHQVAADRGRAFQRLGRRVAEELDEMADVARVLAHRRDREAVVAADHDPHAALAHLLVGRDREFELARQAHPLGDRLGQADDVALEHGIVHEAEGRADDHPVLDGLEHVERLFVGEIAMVDAVGAGAHRALDRLGRAGVNGDALAEIVRRRDAGAELLLADRDQFGPAVARRTRRRRR